MTVLTKGATGYFIEEYTNYSKTTELLNARCLK